MRASERTGAPPPDWSARFDLLYGDLSGQRAVTPEDLRASLGLPPDGPESPQTLIFAAWAWFALCAGLLTLHALDPALDIATWPRTRLLDKLDDILTHQHLHAFDLQPPEDLPPFANIAHNLDKKGIDALRAILTTLFSTPSTLDPTTDPAGTLHAAIFHRNLRHIGGEFYTPPWLASMLVEALEWRPGTTLLDPFGGSGIFLIAAIEAARTHGLRPSESIVDLACADLNPLACLAATLNLTLAIRDDILAGRGRFRIPVRCQDALAPALPSPKAQGPTPKAPPKAQMLATNPPWVGWEYMSRPYRTHTLPAWHTYGLFTARGLKAAFLKEDLSTLALITALDHHLAPNGRAAAVLRASTMTSSLASKGLRRLSIHPDRGPLRLDRIWTFGDLRVFPTARTQATAWMLTRDATTTFPVPVTALHKHQKRWKPRPDTTWTSLRAHTDTLDQVALPADPNDPGSRWLIGAPGCADAARHLEGTNPYTGRTGVFTGGANAVYYLDPLDPNDTSPTPTWRNVTARARRAVAPTTAPIEAELVYPTLRGRDLHRWRPQPGAHLLCPHTSQTRIHAIDPDTMAARYPHAMAYLTRMRPTLDARRGFSGWEQAFREAAFYAVQRVGAYTFAPWKVAWRYISRDFVTAVVGPDPTTGRPRLCNDKIIFIGLDDPEEAHYLCGLLTCAAIRWRVTAYATGTQISASALRPLRLPHFDPHDPHHRAIADACLQGHKSLQQGKKAAAQAALDTIDTHTQALFDLDDTQLDALNTDLRRRYPDPWFK